MIQNSKQYWSIGKEVKVGFLRMTVIDIKSTPGDFKPDAYLLTNGKKFYYFIPHNGLSELYNKYGTKNSSNIEEAKEYFKKL